MNLKICHVTSVHPAKDGRIFSKQCCSLANAGYDVTIVAPNAEDRVLNGIKIRGVYLKSNSRIYRIFVFSKLIYKKALSIDANIYQIHDPELLIIALKLKRQGKIVIFDSHEDVPGIIKSKFYIPKPFRLFISYLYSIYEKYVLKRIDAAISVTPAIVDRLATICPKAVLVTNYPIIQNNTNLNSISRVERNVCFAGNIVSDYMHHNILKALSKINNVTYFLIGEKTQYLEYLSGLEGWDKVRYYGKLPYDEVLKVYAKTSIGLAIHDYTPNAGYRHGSLGTIKIFEFMMLGIPIVCTDFTLWRNIIDKEKCGIYVDPHNTDEISRAIKTLLDNPILASEMGKNGILAVEREYNWKSQEKVLLNLYKSFNL
ncbi:MAG: glycosyltransferase [Bacteroidales bacterium]|nr:glycosyltransferase [Bacteroidales bacterium]